MQEIKIFKRLKKAKRIKPHAKPCLCRNRIYLHFLECFTNPLLFYIIKILSRKVYQKLSFEDLKSKKIGVHWLWKHLPLIRTAISKYSRLSCIQGMLITFTQLPLPSNHVFSIKLQSNAGTEKWPKCSGLWELHHLWALRIKTKKRYNFLTKCVPQML